jgi:hypothetical protein
VSFAVSNKNIAKGSALLNPHLPLSHRQSGSYRVFVAAVRMKETLLVSLVVAVMRTSKA